MQNKETSREAGFSSADFSRTQSSLKAHLPERLIHRAVASDPASGPDTKHDLERDPEHERFNQVRKHPVHVVDLPSRTISVTLGSLSPGQSTNLHRHNYETIIYVLEGEGESQVEDRILCWKAGDAFYIPVWAWHSHRNVSDQMECRYLACENAPLLQNLGRLDLREESL